jgi:NAD(P)-dependent dehydrogenase (short-subunit alcohol dehydrogenase family)
VKEKVVLVAGAATGLGAASARRPADEGASVVVADLDPDGARRTVSAIGDAGGEAVEVGFDIADEASVGELVPTTVRTYGGLDAVHINAGDMGAVAKDTDVVDMDPRGLGPDLRRQPAGATCSARGTPFPNSSPAAAARSSTPRPGRPSEPTRSHRV